LYLIFMAAAVFTFSSWVCKTGDKKVKPKFMVAGSVMQTVSYCGGAKPTQEILDSCNTPKGIPFAKLFVKWGLVNTEGASIIRSISTDAHGNFSTYLPPGNYCLVEKWKTKPFHLPANNVNQTIDSACFRNLYSSADFVLKIKDKNIRDVKIIFHRTCSFNQPCITFHGSLPPKQMPRH